MSLAEKKLIGLLWNFSSCLMTVPTPESDASVVSNISVCRLLLFNDIFVKSVSAVFVVLNLFIQSDVFVLLKIF